MKRRVVLRLVLWLMGLGFLSLAGCGGGRMTPLGAPPPRATVSGRVLVNAAALPARQAAYQNLVSDQPVAGATVGFYLSGSSTPLATAVTGETGAFQFTVPLGASGELRATKGNRLLMNTLVLAMNQTQLSRDITLLSTLTRLLQQDPLLGDLSEADIEAIVLLGEAEELAEQVITAFRDNKALQVDDSLISRAAQSVKVLQEESDASCQPGQQWCVVVSRLKPAAQGSTARVLLRKMPHPLTGDLQEGTVGAGDFTVQWPAGNVLQSLAPAEAFGASGLVADTGDTASQHRNRVIFVVTNPQGIASATVLFDAHLSGPPPSLVQERATVVDQKLRGVLNQKRSHASVKPL